MWLFIAGCTSLPTAMPPTSEQQVRLRAEFVAPEALAEALEDEQAAPYITAVELELQNIGAEAFAFAPSRAALVGPRRQRIPALDPAEVANYARGKGRWSGPSTPPYAASQQGSGRPIAWHADEKALRSQTLAPGDASQGWLYFPSAVARASADSSRQWLLVVVLQDQRRQLREFRVRVEPAEEDRRQQRGLMGGDADDGCASAGAFGMPRRRVVSCMHGC